MAKILKHKITGSVVTLISAGPQNVVLRSSDGYDEVYPVTQHFSAEKILSDYHPA